MGLIDFVKEAGEKLFSFGNKEAKAAEAAAAQEAEDRAKAEALSGLVTKMGFEVNDLNLAFKDGVATLHGTVPSQEIREKIILMVGNTQGVGQVDDRMSVVRPEPEATMYTVKSGDSLSKIAKTHYGNANAYMKIFDANKPMLKDPDKIYPGQVLRIPAEK